MRPLIYKYRKENSKIYSEHEGIINFSYYAICIKAGLRLSCAHVDCLKHGYFKPKCHNLHDFQLILVPVQRTTQTSLRIFVQNRLKVHGAKFNCHESGSLFLVSNNLSV